jgi:hypothetical protein
MRFICRFLVLLAVSSPAHAQTASLRGQVTDQNGAVVPAAKVTLNGPSGPVKTATTTPVAGIHSRGCRRAITR